MKKISVPKLIRAILLIPASPFIFLGALMLGDCEMIEFYYSPFKD